MFKLFHKKLNKKGFTLAELLVVIAIIAILVAIAIPVFTNMVAEAQLRVNQANVRSVRAAAVTKILTKFSESDDSTAGKRMNLGVSEKGGWVGIAVVDNAGNVDGLSVMVVDDISKYADGIFVGTPSHKFESNKWSYTHSFPTYNEDKEGVFYAMPADPDNHNCGFASVRPTTNNKLAYTVQVVITDLDLS